MYRNNSSNLYFLLFLFLIIACGDDNNDGTITPTPAADLPVLNIENSASTEGNEEQQILKFTVFVQGTYTEDIQVTYRTQDASALGSIDYVAADEILTIKSPATSAEIEIAIIPDDLNEGNEHFLLQLFDAENATIKTASARGIINNDDTALTAPEGGYSTPDSYPDWELTWAEEFKEGPINQDNWTFELGNGCNQGLCGWGNQELQSYTADSTNARIEDDNLIIEAHKTGNASYSSARMITKDKQNFRFGRIDIRAQLPKGQGIWPALWMLGKNIDQVGWPACGEIDIMELVGHEPKVTHGTAHFGPPSPNNRFIGSSFNAKGPDFSETYHVFTLVWNPGSIYWYVDDVLFHEINPDITSGAAYPFNQEFFFIFNVAVGGLWPGSPDETTVFPQQMKVDYIRFFEKE